MLSTASARSIGQSARRRVDASAARECWAGRRVAPGGDRGQRIGVNVARLPLERRKTLGEVDARAHRCRWQFPAPARAPEAIRQARRQSARGSAALPAPSAARPRPEPHRSALVAHCAALHLLEHPLGAQVHLEPRQREHPSAKAISGSVSIAGLTPPPPPQHRARADARRSARPGRRSPPATPSGSSHASQDPRECASSCRAASRARRRCADRPARDRRPSPWRELPEHQRRHDADKAPARPTKSPA